MNRQIPHILIIIILMVISGRLTGQKDSAIQLYLINPALSDTLTQTKRKNVNLPDSIVSYAKTFLGDRYRRGGTTVKGFDCSGYTMTIFRKFGIKLPHTSAGQSFIGIEVNRKQISKGDLLFFRGRSSRRKRIGHVGIVISKKGEPVMFIHSSTSQGVRIDRLDSDYYRKRFIKATRVIQLINQPIQSE